MTNVKYAILNFNNIKMDIFINFNKINDRTFLLISSYHQQYISKKLSLETHIQTHIQGMNSLNT